MMEEIQITENQHYVPRCYLRNFALNVGKPRKPKYMIGFYQFSEDLLKESVCSIESVCNKDFFYDTDNTVEHMLRDKESNWAWVIRSAINKSQSGSANALTTEEIFFLKEFAIYQYIRTPSNLNYNVLQTAEALFYIFIREHSEYLNSNESLSDGWLACIAKSRESITPAWFVQNCDDLLKIIDDLKLSLVRNTTQKQFITSDAPIIILNPYTIRHCGLGMIGIVIVYPIDEYTGVIIYDEKMYSMLPGVIELCSEADVDALNAYQFVTAEDFLLSKEDEVLKVIKDDEGLTDKRNHFKEKNKIALYYKRNSEMLYKLQKIM